MKRGIDVEEDQSMMYPYEDLLSRIYLRSDQDKACVELADKYITERNLPDSAIDVLDEAGAVVGTENDTESPEIISLREKIYELSANIEKLKKEDKYDEADALEKEQKHTANKLAEFVKREEEFKKAHKPTVGIDVIYDIIASKTGIPLSRLSTDDKKKLTNIDERLKQNVIGQDEAIDIICKALKRNRVGFKKNGCQFSALMLGRTGVGKCVSGSTKVRIRNKKTGEIQELTLNELKILLTSSRFS